MHFTYLDTGLSLSFLCNLCLVLSLASRETPPRQHQTKITQKRQWQPNFEVSEVYFHICGYIVVFLEPNWTFQTKSKQIENTADKPQAWVAYGILRSVQQHFLFPLPRMFWPESTKKQTNQQTNKKAKQTKIPLISYNEVQILQITRKFHRWNKTNDVNQHWSTIADVLHKILRIACSLQKNFAPRLLKRPFDRCATNADCRFANCRLKRLAQTSIQS